MVLNIETVGQLMEQDINSVVNKTRKYLAPCLLAYGTRFAREFRKFSTFGTFISDQAVSPSQHPEIYYLLNIRRSKISSFLDSIIYLRKHRGYITDYLVGDLIYGRLHMIVLKVPDIHTNSYFRFLESKYSEMYTASQINEYLAISKGDNAAVKDRKRRAHSVLSKDPLLVEDIATEYGVSMSSITELDDKLLPDQEVFNYDNFSIEDLYSFKEKSFLKL